VASIVNGVACAWLDRAPLLVFTDSHPAAGAAFTHQRVDHRALLAPITKWSATLTPANVDAVMREAIDRAMIEPRGPVHLECPGDVLTKLEAPADDDATETRVAAYFDETGRVLLDPATLAPMLSGKRRPLLLVGLGARRPLDAQAIVALCASRGIPAMVTYKAKGTVPDLDPHFAGVFTNGEIERAIVEEADVLIGVGLDPVELIPRPWTYEQPIIHIGPAAIDGGQIPFAAQLVTDIPSGMQLCDGLLPPSSWDLDAVHRIVVVQRHQLCPPSAGLAAHRVVQLAADAAATQGRVTVDAGAHMFPATMLWPVAEPNGMLISNGLSTMGFALPAAVGAALLDRGKPVVALTGDGGLLMCVGELLTAVREKLRVITIVFSDASLSLIEIKQQARRLEPSGVALGAIDWVGLARSFGAASWSAADDGALDRAIGEALQCDGPSLIEAKIDRSNYGATLRAVRG
jgi:acetolactate synthase-1/2/3 large subunit